MSNCFPISTATAAAFGVLILAVNPGQAPAQDKTGGKKGGRPQAVEHNAPPKPKPHGAWWYTGGQHPAGPVDLTGVWYGGSSGDLSKQTIPGQELLLTPYGKQRYDTVD